jgi:hypothetical protein
MNLEDDLRRTLRRNPAPPELLERVRAAIERNDVVATRVPPSNAWRALPWLAAAAAITLMAARGTLYYGDRQQVTEARRVQSDIRIAFEITNDKIGLVQRKMHDTFR